MYGSQTPSEVEGAIFKLWGKSAAPIEWCSFMPKEREFLFLPGTKFRVRAWYPATQVHMRRGMRQADGESDQFKLRCDHLVQPVPLQVVDSDVELRKQLVHNKVVVFEMEEVNLSEEEERVEFEKEERSEADMVAMAGKYKSL